MNILLTSVGRRTYLVKYFKEALGKLGEIHVSNSSYSIAMDFADNYLVTPLIYEKNYIPTLLNYCINNNINAIISLFDIDLLVLSKHKDLFLENKIRLVLAPENSVRICNDKWETYNFLKKTGIKTPISFLTIKNAISAIKNKELTFPLIIKPRWGMASLGIYVADNIEELTILYKKSVNDIFKTYLKYESNLTKKTPVIIQEFLNGQEYGLDVINDLDSNYVTTFAKKKIAMRAGETDIGETVAASKFINISKKISLKIKHEGILSVDCIIVGKEIYVIEMNCRISGHYPLSHLAGANIPKQIILWLNNQKTDQRLLQIKEGLLITKDLVPTIIKINKKKGE